MILSTRNNNKIPLPDRSDGGFTLIEIIVVVGIIGVIIGAIYPFLNTINRWGGVSQNNMQQFEDSVNNYFLAISKQIRNANGIDIYDNDGLVSNEGNKIIIHLVSGRTLIYQKNQNSIEVIESSPKKIVPEVTNITIDNNTPLFKDLTTNKRKNIELKVKISYSVGTVNGSKTFTSSVTKRN